MTTTISTALDNITQTIGQNILRIGSTGENVKHLQAFLGVQQDGIFGNQTKNALVELQKKLGISADGIYGPQTAQAISNVVN